MSCSISEVPRRKDFGDQSSNSSEKPSTAASPSSRIRSITCSTSSRTLASESLFERLLDALFSFLVPAFVAPTFQPFVMQILVDNPVSYTHLRAHETVLDLVC